MDQAWHNRAADPMPPLKVPVFLLLLALCASPAAAQRSLHWDSVEVAATLDATGTLTIVETHAMVFTGDWNGGERIFNIRPRQQLRLHGVLRGDGQIWRRLTEDRDLDDVDEFAWTDATRLRWRSRRPGDPLFSNTVIRYQLHYALDGILQKSDDGYLLDHDFLFPDRDGEVRSFSLRLVLDPAWEGEIRERYAAERVPPGRSFVLTVPLRYVGEGEPAALDTGRPPEIVRAVQMLLSVSAVAILWLLLREARRGRFAPLPPVDGEGWLQQHVLAHPAEVIGAAWDDGVGSAEVVALLARMVTEGKLESDVSSRSSISLRLLVDRETLHGYERDLIDKLFFEGRVQTSTALVKQHYKKTGFRPAEEIRAGVGERLDALLPTSQTGLPGMLAGVLLLLSLGLLVVDAFRGGTGPGAAVAVGICGLILLGIGSAAGHTYRGKLHLGIGAALLTLLPAALPIAAVTWFLWAYAGLGHATVSPAFTTALTAMGLAVLFTTIASMRSRQRPEGMAFRKRLASARAHFARELEAPNPALKDEWFPWLLAFGLGGEMDAWSVAHADVSHRHRSSSRVPSASWSSTASTPSTVTAGGGWTGFAGGRSGGAGAAASWSAAAGTMAAGVAPPGSSGSSGSGSSSSSSGGSSGGGGGGGW